METRTLFVVGDHYEYGFQYCSCLVVYLERIMSIVLKTAQLHKSCNTNTILVSKNVSKWTLVFLVLVLGIYYPLVASIFSLKICIILHLFIFYRANSS
jgi:hypothetical protein